MNNKIGLDKAKTDNLVDALNKLLADYQVLYMNVRGFHWNIKGEKFFELHAKFEELYDELLVKVDELAERVLTLGGTPVHAFSDYLAVSDIAEAKGISEGTACVQSILDAYKVLLEKQREILNLAGEADDEGTNALMSDYIREQEKEVWMYTAFLGK